MPVKRLRGLLLLPLVLLGGCHMVLLDPSGDVARQQSDIMISTTIIIALIIVPVLIAIGVVGWRYRAANRKARFDPEWDHSTQLELLVWAAPLLIIIAVGAISWIGTHKTDPYADLHRLAQGKTVPADAEPLQVDVVSMRWKWLFFYPQYGIATVNELAAPVNRPIEFRLTSSDMMDAFFVPDLAGMVYTMPGMQTELHAVINHPGKYKGMSSNFSGPGFSWMNFWFYGKTEQGFDAWVAKVRASGRKLDLAAYEKLHRPQKNVPVQYYDGFARGLYTRILNRCVIPGQVCISHHMAQNAPSSSAMHAMQGEPQARASAPADPSKSVAASAAAAH